MGWYVLMSMAEVEAKGIREDGAYSAAKYLIVNIWREMMLSSQGCRTVVIGKQ